MKNPVLVKNLYGLTKKGLSYTWKIEVGLTDLDYGKIIISRGLVDGKLHQTSELITSGKNIGKSNETTPISQAVFNAESKIRKKLDNGYGYTIDESRKKYLDLLKPMLAQSYEKHKKKLIYPCASQPKLDGIRCLARKKGGIVTLYSRQGKVLALVPQINRALSRVLEDGECADGELYVHTWDFQRIVSAIKKVSKDTQLIEYHIYDMPNQANRDMPFSLRFEEKKRNNLIGIDTSIHVVETATIKTEVELQNFEQLCIDAGYEGIMARNLDSKYLFGYRSSDLLKVKRFIDSEYKIIDVTDGLAIEKGCAVFICETLDGQSFGVRPVGTHKERKTIYLNKKSYIGKLLTVKYQDLSNDGIPRFPVGLHLRDPWDMDR
tara:strand:- start:724 stop:1857 length:1134 start_codon:yes stop_codon:yes gene_type:complete